MITFLIYLTGSVILTIVSAYGLLRALVLDEPWGTHAGFLIASLLFVAGGVAGLVGL